MDCPAGRISRAVVLCGGVWVRFPEVPGLLPELLRGAADSGRADFGTAVAAGAKFVPLARDCAKAFVANRASNRMIIRFFIVLKRVLQIGRAKVVPFKLNYPIPVCLLPPF